MLFDERTPGQQLLVRATRRLRLEQGLTLRDAGELLGIDASNVSRAEAGARRPPTADELAAAFDVPVEEVLRPCPRCDYDPPAGYCCLRCGTGKELPEERPVPPPRGQGLDFPAPLDLTVGPAARPVAGNRVSPRPAAWPGRRPPGPGRT